MKVITLVGNATKNAEIQNTQNGDSVCSFALAVNDSRSQETYYFDCTYWGRAGEAVAPYIEKGKQITVSGEFSWREYNSNKYLQCNVQSLALGQRPKAGDEPSGSGDQNRPSNDMDDEIPF